MRAAEAARAAILDAVTRKVQGEIREVLKTMEAIRAEHRRFLKKMNGLQQSAKPRLSK